MLTAYFSGMAITAYILSKGAEKKHKERSPIRTPALAIIAMLSVWPLLLGIGASRWLLERGK